ncbi:MAG TPA: M28 family peptidase [Gemmatimonadaceae bacterium]
MTAARGPTWVAPITYWSTAAAIVVWLLVLIAWRDLPPAPAPATAPASAFSAERAWPVLSHLADSIGYRVAGTPGADSAAAYLLRRLRATPGVEVVVQDATGAWRRAGHPLATAYAVRNVLVRIPGRERTAVLLSAHYDSPPESVGAADDGVAVAALVEVVRALARGPRLRHTIIVNFDDAEEQGLVGAHAFTHHPWARDVRGFVNLESAGPHGRAVLFQSGPGNPWLVDAYARAVPYPFGTVTAQDIFQSGAIPSDTDFRIYRDYGALRGLDIALFEGGWAYHTQRDRTWNVSHGTMQQVGANALALARGLADGELPGDVSAEPAVYYDLLGLVMVHYPASTARWLAVAALLLGALALALARRRHRLRLRDVVLALLFGVMSLAGALATALILSVIPAYVLGRPMAWFAHPGAATAAFALAALAPMLLVARGLGWLLERRGVDAGPRGAAALGGALVLWMALLAALTIAGIGSAYLALWWVAGIAVAVALAALLPDERWWIPALAGALPAALLTLSLVVMLVRLFVPVFGRLPLAIAPDLVLAALVAIPAALLSLVLLPGAMRAGALGWSSAVALGVAVVALGAGLALPRYTPAHPQRLTIVHAQTAGDSAGTLRVVGEDFATPRAALAAVPAMRPASGDPRPLAFEMPAGPTRFPAPTVARLTSGASVALANPTGASAPGADSAGARRDESTAAPRALALRITAPGAYRLRLHLPRARVAAWSLPLPLPSPAMGDDLRADFAAPPDTGWVLDLRVRGAAPLPVRVDALRAVMTHDAAALERELPPWADSHVIVVNSAEVER